jgi:hypothetical protein
MGPFCRTADHACDQIAGRAHREARRRDCSLHCRGSEESELDEDGAYRPPPKPETDKEAYALQAAGPLDHSEAELDQQFDNADYWWNLARERHEWAEDILDSDLRAMMQRIAEAYDEIARLTGKRVTRSQLH